MKRYKNDKVWDYPSYLRVESKPVLTQIERRTALYAFAKKYFKRVWKQTPLQARMIRRRITRWHRDDRKDGPVVESKWTGDEHI